MTSEDDKVSLFLGGFDEDRQAGILGSLNLGGRSGVDLTHSLTDICCLSFSPDGSFLVVGCEDGRLCALSGTSGALEPSSLEPSLTCAWAHCCQFPGF
eukprot:m.161443 g.161443  ORF g.161443 m.161443 type:complete len:98 (-) comp53040_c0_seq32:926-1219(-)